jgi:hypothetical protein
MAAGAGEAIATKLQPSKLPRCDRRISGSHFLLEDL